MSLLDNPLTALFRAEFSNIAPLVLDAMEVKPIKEKMANSLTGSRCCANSRYRKSCPRGRDLNRFIRSLNFQLRWMKKYRPAKALQLFLR